MRHLFNFVWNIYHAVSNVPVESNEDEWEKVDATDATSPQSSSAPTSTTKDDKTEKSEESKVGVGKDLN